MLNYYAIIKKRVTNVLILLSLFITLGSCTLPRSIDIGF